MPTSNLPDIVVAFVLAAVFAALFALDKMRKVARWIYKQVNFFFVKAKGDYALARQAASKTPTTAIAYCAWRLALLVTWSAGAALFFAGWNLSRSVGVHSLPALVAEAAIGGACMISALRQLFAVADFYSSTIEREPQA